MVKKWYESKLIWLGILQLVASVVQFVIEFIQAGDYSPESIVMGIAGVLVIIFRKVTYKAIA